MRNKLLTKLVAIQTMVIGFWLAAHDNVAYYSRVKNIEFIDSPIFYGLAIVIGIGLLLSVFFKRKKLQRLSLVLLNMIWVSYTTILVINELNGIPNMSWTLLLGYNIVIYLAARYEVDK